MRPNSVAKTHERLVQQAALLEVLEQAGDRLIDGQSEPGVVGLQVRVGIPGAGAAAAVLDLDEPHAALDQPPRRQELHAELAACG